MVKYDVALPVKNNQLFPDLMFFLMGGKLDAENVSVNVQ